MSEHEYDPQHDPERELDADRESDESHHETFGDGDGCSLGIDPPPSTLFVFWPWSEPPSETEIELRLGHQTERETAPDTEDGDVLWVIAFRVPGSQVPSLIWACAVDELPEVSESCDVHWDDDEWERAQQTRWLLGVETMLRSDAPLPDYHRQLRLCRQICPDAPAIFDASSFHLRSGSLVDRMTTTEIPPRSSELFWVHAIESDDSVSDDARSCWIHTHGLARAGFPDVELLGISSSLARAGCWLSRNFVDRVLGGDLPPPRTPFDVGHEIQIAWIPCAEAIRGLAPDELGGAADRDDEDEHDGRRIVLVDARPRGWLRKRWTPPLRVLERIDRDGAVASISHRETERMSRLARERWPELGMLFARHGKKSGWTFLVKLGYRIDGGESHQREHLWFELDEIVPDRLRGRLLNRPLQVSRLSEDEHCWHELEMLTDWKIFSPLGEFTPENVRYVRRSDVGATD